MFYGSKVEENSQEFLDYISKKLDHMGITIL